MTKEYDPQAFGNNRSNPSQEMEPVDQQRTKRVIGNQYVKIAALKGFRLPMEHDFTPKSAIFIERFDIKHRFMHEMEAEA